MFEGESDVSARRFRQSCVKILAPSFCRLGHDRAQSFKTHDRESIDEVVSPRKRGWRRPRYLAALLDIQLSFRNSRRACSGALRSGGVEHFRTVKPFRYRGSRCSRIRLVSWTKY